MSIFKKSARAENTGQNASELRNLANLTESLSKDIEEIKQRAQEAETVLDECQRNAKASEECAKKAASEAQNASSNVLNAAAAFPNQMRTFHDGVQQTTNAVMLAASTYTAQLSSEQTRVQTVTDRFIAEVDAYTARMQAEKNKVETSASNAIIGINRALSRLQTIQCKAEIALSKSTADAGKIVNQVRSIQHDVRLTMANIQQVARQTAHLQKDPLRTPFLIMGIISILFSIGISVLSAIKIFGNEWYLILGGITLSIIAFVAGVWLLSRVHNIRKRELEQARYAAEKEETKLALAEEREWKKETILKATEIIEQIEQEKERDYAYSQLAGTIIQQDLPEIDT